MKQIIIIADDLTGACDTGIKFKNHGWNTQVLVSPAGSPAARAGEAPVISVNTKTRSTPPEEARRAVAGLLQAMADQGDKSEAKRS